MALPKEATKEMMRLAQARALSAPVSLFEIILKRFMDLPLNVGQSQRRRFFDHAKTINPSRLN